MYADEIFYVPNEDGCMITYQKLTDNTVRIIVDPTEKATWKSDYIGDNLAQCKCDILSLPSIISYEGKDYIVTEIDFNAFYHVSTIKKIIIPASVNTLCGFGFFPYHANPFMMSSIEEIEIDDKNPNYVSYKGMVFSKNMKILHSCPPCYPKDTLVLPEGLQHLSTFSLSNLAHVKTVVLPLTLKYVHNVAFYDSESVQHIVFQDSVKSIVQTNFAHFPNLSDITVGAMLDTIMLNELFWQPLSMHIRAKKVPYSGFSIPESFKNNVPNQKENMEASILYVPRSSVTLYSQAPGWRMFGKILPIEPPIVTGTGNAEVSWVQNFSATGYEWVLYADEAHTKLVMTLVFNASGNLTELRLGEGFMPAPSLRNIQQALLDTDDGTLEKRYADYYSFNITGLRPGTTYWYSCRSLADGNVIEEDKGLFSTLSEGGTGTGPGLVLNGQPGNGHPDNGRNTIQPQKTIENGLIYIRRGDKTYNLFGWQLK